MPLAPLADPFKKVEVKEELEVRNFKANPSLILR